MEKKSSDEQKRAKLQASAGGWAPSPCSIGKLNKKASCENVVWTCKSPKKICFWSKSLFSTGLCLEIMSPSLGRLPTKPEEETYT